MSVTEIGADCRGRVLIVDDQPELAEGLKALLETEGVTVDVRTSLITLPLSIRKFDPDVVLLDLSMPGLSGDAYFAAGAHRFIQSDVPVVLFSGRSRHELSRLTEDLGADGFISKDQDAWDVVCRVQTWIAHRRALKVVAGRKINHAATRTAPAASYQQREVRSGRGASQRQLPRQQDC